MKAARLANCFAFVSALNVEKLRFSETPVEYYETTCHRISKDNAIQDWLLLLLLLLLLVCGNFVLVIINM
jgi:hypothetical protein